MTLVDILIFKFPQANFRTDILIQDDGQGPYIKEWNLTDVVQPTEEQIDQWSIELEPEFKLNNFYKEAEKFLAQHIESVAQSKQYDSTMSIISYANSTVPQWKAEAETFIAWRDTVLSWAYSNFSQVAQGNLSVPSLSELEENIPKIEWPTNVE